MSSGLEDPNLDTCTYRYDGNTHEWLLIDKSGDHSCPVPDPSKIGADGQVVKINSETHAIISNSESGSGPTFGGGPG